LRQRNFLAGDAIGRELATDTGLPRWKTNPPEWLTLGQRADKRNRAYRGMDRRTAMNSEPGASVEEGGFLTPSVVTSRRKAASTQVEL
jgi:hypothetical protein